MHTKESILSRERGVHYRKGERETKRTKKQLSLGKGQEKGFKDPKDEFGNIT